MNGGFTLEGELDLILPITALLPLTAMLLVSQANPYQTLVLRGILGSVATLLYALLGAPDVAITEALVGTLLSTTLYAVALRSSMALRLSFRQGQRPDPESERLLRDWLAPAGLRLSLVPPPEAGGVDPSLCHGRIEPGPPAWQLVLRHPRLLDRLQSLEGYGRWRERGGDLRLEAPLEPPP
jgi:putative multicomponent Na+:H+ antiporter subunit B